MSSPLTEKQVYELRVMMVRRLVELYEENQKLQKEVRSRRRQADTWRKKAQTLERRV